jgi:hypothetical protein
MYKLKLFISKFIKFSTPEEYEDFIGLSSLKSKRRKEWLKNKKDGKYWLACSPEWIGEDVKLRNILDSKYKICYWVNYGDDNTYGRFSVEQIIYWLENKEVLLYTLGGTKER